MNPSIQLKTTPPLLITLTLLCFGLLPKAQAVSPPPDGGYPELAIQRRERDALLSPTNGFFVAFSAKAPAQDITLVQLEAGASDNATVLIGHWRKTTTHLL